MKKKLLIGLFVLLSLVVAAVLVLPGLIDWNVYKDEIAARIGAVTGRAVAIDGDVAFTVLPRPTLTASGVRVASVPRAAHPDMISVGALEVRVSFLSLLEGRVEVERIILVDPVLVLETLPDGSANWGPVEVDPGGLAGAVSLGRISIENGTLLWSDATTGAEERVSKINAQGTARSLSGPMALVGSLEAHGVGLTVDLATGRLAANGMLPVNLTLGVDRLGDELRFAGLGGLGGQLQGDLTVHGADLRAALQRFLPDTAPPAFLAQPFTLRTALLAGPERIDGNALSLDLGVTHGTGSVSLIPPSSGDARRIDIALSLNSVPLDDWLGPAPVFDWPASWPVFRTGEGGVALPADMAASIDLSVDAMDWRGRLIRDARLEAALTEDGMLTLSQLSAQLPGSSELAMIATLHAENGMPVFDASAEANGGDLRGVLEWLGYAVAAVPGERLRRFSAAATLTGTPAEFQVTGVEVSVDTTRLTGSLAFVARDPPGIGLRFALDRLNLDAYGPAALTPDRATLAALLHGVDATVLGEIGSLTVAETTLHGLRLDATLAGGSLTLREAAIGEAAGATLRLTGSVAALDPPDGLDLAVEFRAAAAEPLFRALRLTPPVPPERLGALSVAGHLRGGASALMLELNGTAANAAMALGGSVLWPLAAPIYDLALRVTAPEAQGPIQVLAPGYQPRRPLGSLDLFTVIGGTPQALRFEPVQGSIGPLTLAGSVALAHDGPRPRATVELRTGELDIDSFLPTRPPVPAGAVPERWPEAPFDLGALKAVDGTLGLNAASIALGDLRITAPALRASLSDGTIELTRLSGGLFGGTLGLSGRLSAGERPALSLSLDVVAARLGETLATLLGVAPGDGALDFGLTAATAGRSEAELVAGLAGQGLIAVRDGELNGLDLGAVERLVDRPGGAAGFAERLRGALSSGRTAFAALNIPFTIAGGVAQTEALRLVTGEGLGVGQGRLDLPHWQLDLTTAFTLDRQPEAPPFGVRLVGPPDDPERRLETEALQSYAVRRAAASTPDGPADRPGSLLGAPVEPALRR